MKLIKKNVVAIIIKVVGFIASAIIIKVLGNIDLAWLKELVYKILEFKLIIAVVIAGIIIIIATVKYFSYICKFFKWLLIKYFRFVWKIIGISDFMNFLEKLKQKKGSTDFDSGVENDIEAYLFTKIYGRHYADVKKKKE